MTEENTEIKIMARPMTERERHQYAANSKDGLLPPDQTKPPNKSLVQYFTSMAAGVLALVHQTAPTIGPAVADAISETTSKTGEVVKSTWQTTADRLQNVDSELTRTIDERKQQISEERRINHTNIDATSKRGIAEYGKSAGKGR